MKKGRLFLPLCCALAVFLGTNASQGAELPASPSVEDATSADAVRQMQDQKLNFVLMDARSLRNYQAEHIEGAILPMISEYYEKQALFQANVISVPPDVDEFLKRSMEKYPKDTKIITYCNKDCHASEVLMSKLRLLGFSDVKFMQSGIDAWKEKGYPVAAPAADLAK